MERCQKPTRDEGERAVGRAAEVGPCGRAHRRLKDLADDWLETDDSKIERFRRVDGRTEARVRLAGPPPPEIAVIAGEAVHCLRSALDNAVFASALYGGTLDEKIERDLEFPVVGTGTKADFDRLAKRRLAGVPEAVRHVVEEDQPYHFNDSRPGAYVFHWVWTIHDLDRIDKHRRLAVTAAAVRHAAVGIPDGIEPEVKFFSLRRPRRARPTDRHLARRSPRC
jgi:hypothetical protein